MLNTYYRMEDLLCLYAEYFTPFNPIVCFDERPYQLLVDIVEPLPCQAGQPARIDYQYSRKGVCNLFVFYAPHYGWRHVEVIQSRTKQDFAHQMKALVDVYFPLFTFISILGCIDKIYSLLAVTDAERLHIQCA